MIASYLFAIVIANLAVAEYGSRAILFTAFFLIPFDLFARDVLHERWHKDDLLKRMTLLIVSGGVLSALMNADALIVAFASSLAFLVAGATNTAIYQKMYRHHRFVKMNLSNLCAAASDSLVFVLILFYDEDPVSLIIFQTLVKTGGGLFWTSIYLKVRQWQNRK